MANDFKWFGEGFDGFPKILPEDCVEYYLYIIDTRLRDVEVRDKLRQVQKSATSLCKQLLNGFIWQREAFSISLERGKVRSYLCGRTNYGDSIDDEWLIVYILRKLSQEFSDLWIRVVDSDGQFLLIEAANALPLWLNPEIADFRVWINHGKLLIIPLEKPGGTTRASDQDADNMTLESAIAWISSPQKTLQHSSKIEAEAFFRLQNYPQQITSSMHHALILIPRKLAYVLHANAATISAAVEAFYLRDPIALKPLQSKEAVKLTFPPDDIVRASVKFTKVGYAQLKSQQFPSPPAWVSKVEKAMSMKSNDQAQMGMKLACGFEMFMSDSQNRDKKAFREISLLLEDLKAGDAQLPSDGDMKEWSLRDDDDKWLDINYEEFEKELAGKGVTKSAKQGAGFGDKGAQNNLRKVVERFENFLKDDEAGPEGTEFIDDMDNDDDANDSDQPSTISNDSTPACDTLGSDTKEDEFTAMMREMLDMPADVMNEMMSNPVPSAGPKCSSVETCEKKREDRESIAEDEDKDGVLDAMHRIGQELRDAGALDLEPHAGSDKALYRKRIGDIKGSVGADASASPPHGNRSRRDFGDADYNLANNLLESLKSQGGAPGPSGNLMGLMGIKMPRDESEDE